jgi:hypothetical protein
LLLFAKGIIQKYKVFSKDIRKNLGMLTHLNEISFCNSSFDLRMFFKGLHQTLWTVAWMEM